MHIEVKTISGVQSQYQKEFEQLVKSKGGHYIVVRSIDDLQAKLTAIVKGL